MGERHTSGPWQATQEPGPGHLHAALQRCQRTFACMHERTSEAAAPAALLTMCSTLYPSTMVTPVGRSPGPLTVVLNMACVVRGAAAAREGWCEW